MFQILNFSLPNPKLYFEGWNRKLLTAYKKLNLTCEIPMMLNFPSQTLGLPYCSNQTEAFLIAKWAKDMFRLTWIHVYWSMWFFSLFSELYNNRENIIPCKSFSFSSSQRILSVKPEFKRKGKGKIKDLKNITFPQFKSLSNIDLKKMITIILLERIMTIFKSYWRV